MTAKEKFLEEGGDDSEYLEKDFQKPGALLGKKSQSGRRGSHGINCLDETTLGWQPKALTRLVGGDRVGRSPPLYYCYGVLESNSIEGLFTGPELLP